MRFTPILWLINTGFEKMRRWEVEKVRRWERLAAVNMKSNFA
jgi:hypothetical protein